MIFNISFIDKNMKITFDKTKSKDKFLPGYNAKKISKKEELYIKATKKVEPIEILEKKDEELSQKKIANIEEVQKYNESLKEANKMLLYCLEQEENSPQKALTFDLSENNYDNIENFLNNFSIFQDYITKDFITNSKKLKKSLILPDEIVGFDTLTIPALSPFKINGVVKFKLSLDFVDFENLNLLFKPIVKEKPNVTYVVHFLKKQVVNDILSMFKKMDINFKSVNFYSSCLANFYNSKLHLSKQNALIVKIDKTHTTIIAISHGNLIFTYSLSCGTLDILENKAYKFDEHSKKMTAYKYICYKINSSNNSEKTQNVKNVSLEKVEKEFSQSRTNLLAPVFQTRNVYSADIVCQKIDEILLFLLDCELKMSIDKIYIDTESEDVFNAIKIENAEMIKFDETEIFAKIKPNPLFKFSKIKNISKKFSWRNLWKKQNKKE